MTKKEFKVATREAFEKYGFKTDGKLYKLDLPDVIVAATLIVVYGEHRLGYNFSIKAIHDESEYLPNDIFTCYESHLINMYTIEGKTGIDYENCTIEEYKKNLEEMLSRYFDPYKNDAINFIKKCNTIVGLVYKDDIIFVKKKAHEFLFGNYVESKEE